MHRAFRHHCGMATGTPYSIESLGFIHNRFSLSNVRRNARPQRSCNAAMWIFLARPVFFDVERSAVTRLIPDVLVPMQS